MLRARVWALHNSTTHVEAFEKAHPAPESFAGIAKGMKDAA